MVDMPAIIRSRVERLLGKRLVTSERIRRGYTAALRAVVTCEDGSRAFIKGGTSPDTAAWLRDEVRLYQALGSQPFLACVLGWEDDADQPLLILEDLALAYWPPPWTEARVQQVVETLGHVAACSSIPALPKAEDEQSLLDGWQRIAADPVPFLSLGLATERWLQAVLPTLLSLDFRAVLRGDALLHMDVRSDNLCFVKDQTILVDWNWAMVGNPQLDIAAWLPSLAAEGGPLPETILPDAGVYAAMLSGFFGARAGLPPPEGAPNVRALQVQQLAIALPWMVRTLGLPALRL